VFSFQNEFFFVLSVLSMFFGGKYLSLMSFCIDFDVRKMGVWSSFKAFAMSLRHDGRGGLSGSPFRVLVARMSRQDLK